MTKLKIRGVRDVLIACADGLKGFPQAIESVYPEARVQLCIVHMVRASLNYVNWKERKPVAADLKLSYRAATEQQAEQELSEFTAKWGHKYQAIGMADSGKRTGLGWSHSSNFRRECGV